MPVDRHPEVGGRTVGCTCCTLTKPARPTPAVVYGPMVGGVPPAVPGHAYGPEQDGLTAADAAALIDKEVG